MINTAAQLGSALVLGVVEGLTEFIPVSSTGHLIFVGSLLGFQDEFGKLFEVVIQLGAVLAVVVISAPKLFVVAGALPSDAKARRFVLAIVIAFIPSAILGLALHSFIKSVLFSPAVVAFSLIVGGIAILVIERLASRVHVTGVEQMPLFTALWIGFCQALSMVPGVSRAGATILGGVAFGVERKTATEFSFFLAIPTMLGATIVDLWKTPLLLSGDAWLTIGTGFIAAFVMALIVIRWLLHWVGRHGFAIFGWYRILIGSIAAYVIFAH